MICPHKNSKHYAKVSSLIFDVIRVCATTVTTSTEEIQKQQTVLTLTDLSTQKENVKIAI